MVPSLPPLSVIHPEPEQGEREHEHERQPSRPLQQQYQQPQAPAPAYARVAPPAAYPSRFQDPSYASRFAPPSAFRPSHGDTRAAEAWRRIKTEDDRGGHGDAAYQHHHEQLRSMTQHYVGGTARHPVGSAFAAANDSRTSQSGSSHNSSHSHSHSHHHHSGSVNSHGGRSNKSRFSSSDDDDEGDDENSRKRRGQRAGGHFASSSSVSSQERYTVSMVMPMTGGGAAAAAAVGAMDASGRASFSSSDVYLDLNRSGSNGGSVQEDDFDPKLSKKARRKEQCRVNQANYRKRKRMYEDELSGQIKLLENEILELKARKIALRHQSPSSSSETEGDQVHNRDHQHRNHRNHYHDPIKSIGDFYYALESGQLEFPPNAQLHYPGLHSLFELHQQEFASIDAFQLQWLWYREHFAVFHLLVSSSERLDAGDQVIIRISAQLHIQMQQQTRRRCRRQRKQDHRHQHQRYQTQIHEAFDGRSDENEDEDENDWFAKKLVCPVLQQFEFHADERVLTQITSEIDWIAGVAALVQSQPEPTLLLLRELASEAAASARFANCC